MSRIRTRSVRFRVTTLATAIVAVVLVAMAFGVVVAQNRSLTAAIDEGLQQRANDLAAVLADQGSVTLVGEGDETAAQLVGVAGDVLAASPNLRIPEPLALLPDGVDELIADRWLAGPNDSFRVLSRRIPTHDGYLTLHIAAATEDADDSIAVLRQSMLVAVPLAVAALAAAIWWVVGKALQPVEDIRREVDSISQTDLGRRVPVPDSGDEIQRLATTMNSMLGRLETGLESLQRFTADASHELRSPLTRIRSELEIEGSDPAADLRSTHASVLEETLAMQALVADLLFLARSDAGRQPADTQRIDLDDIVFSVASGMSTHGDPAVSVAGVSAGQISGDRSQLERLVGNLADNAVRHAATKVEFGLYEDTDGVVLTVSDDGPGIPVADRERVFERFARVDESRSRRDGGSGLGLAIVRDIATRHGGTASIDPDYRAGTCVVVRFPRP